MKKNVMMRVASALLVAVLMTTCAISGTFAKYTSTQTSSDTARVAKWDIKLNGKSITEAFEFDLFKTVKDSDNSDETDIKVNDGTIIAPGTQGSFEIVLKNDSEVTAEYVIDYTVTNANNIPVVFSLDGSTWKSNINELDVTTPVTIAIGATAPTITVYWMWAFNGGDDAADTTLGLGGTATITVEAKVTVTQVN